MRRTENRCRSIVWWLSKFFLHNFPRFYHVLLSCASHMVAVSAILEVALNATTIFLVADSTLQFTSCAWQCTTNCGYVIVIEPHLRRPVDANNMSPFWLISSDRFDNSFNFGTHWALYFCAGHILVLNQLYTSGTEPRLISIRESVLNLTTIARLVSCCLA